MAVSKINFMIKKNYVGLLKKNTTLLTILKSCGQKIQELNSEETHLTSRSTQNKILTIWQRRKKKMIFFLNL